MGVCVFGDPGVRWGWQARGGALGDRFVAVALAGPAGRFLGSPDADRGVACPGPVGVAALVGRGFERLKAGCWTG